MDNFDPYEDELEEDYSFFWMVRLVAFIVFSFKAIANCCQFIKRRLAWKRK